VRVATLLAVLLAALVAGCGGDDVEGEVRERTERVQDEVARQRERLRDRIREVLSQIERALPEAQVTSPRVQSRGRTEGRDVDAFLSDVFASVDSYWKRTFRASDLPEPSVRHYWLAPGERIITRCGPASDEAAYYCSVDDRIYVSRQFAADLWDGVARGLPGQSAGVGRAAGDFGVAYVVAHEYGHNIQDELNLFTLRRGRSAEPFELQADCFAGAWGNSVYVEGRLEPGDVEEAMATALAVGDFDVGNDQHHGTPEQRRAAWLEGFQTGDASVCQKYVPTN